ncbi:PASTA domain-containing protein [Actinoplanes rectilineatus]|uniref:PASTA domain-containing protein n=1 Tax=Actinoplanes rectilineatus TaxID=113571 RepID=UPI0009F8975C|nr:PASTA domain-containing protein [Actinoplanes rectilineatus]
MIARRLTLGLTVMTLLAVAACGSPDDPAEPAPVVTTTVVTTSAAPESTTTAAPAPKAAKIKVPDGVGLDYQSAQDLWRAAGLHVAPAKDATGANRLPVIDANWVVLSQDPKAGTTVEADSFITATVKKNTDG